MPDYTFNFSPETYRKMLEEAVRARDFDAYMTLVDQGADPLMPMDDPEPGNDYDMWTYEHYDPEYGPRGKLPSLLAIAMSSQSARIARHLFSIGATFENTGLSKNFWLTEWAYGSRDPQNPNCEWEDLGALLFENGCCNTDHPVWIATEENIDKTAMNMLLLWKAKQEANAISSATWSLTRPFVNSDPSRIHALAFDGQNKAK